MTISKPSREIYSVDIPEVKDFSARFHYNFFVPDEGVNDTGGVPEKILTRPADSIDADFLQFATTRAPRVVTFQFSPPRIANVGNEVTDLDIRNNVLHSSNASSLIADNLDKIVTEDHFSSFGFISVQFQDSDVDQKVYSLVSGSLEQHTLGEETDHNASYPKAASRLSNLLPSTVSPHFLASALSQIRQSAGVQFHTSDSVVGNSATNKWPTVKNLITTSGHGETSRLDIRFQRLKQFQINSQINGKLFYSIINRTISDPQSPFSDDLHSIHQFSKQVTSANVQQFSLQVSENDYKTVVPFIDLKVQPTAHQTNRQPAELVGFLIDKVEVTKDGTTQQHPSIIIENPKIGSTADFKVRYDSTYLYSIRSVAKFTLPAIDNVTGDIATIQMLVSSRPSAKVMIKATEKIPPPPPAELDFTWDYENDKLLVHWSFPTNSQRDIKKFQVFRRREIDHPFELLKMYDFDDSVIKYEDKEDPLPSLIEYVKSPVNHYIDDDFKKESKFIYAVASIDAHGMTSNLSAQFELTFDQFKNKLLKKLVSHSGAPKPYPNLYLEADTFVDTIRVRGPHSKRLRLYFNPEFYFITNENDALTKVLATKQQQGEYKLQLLNLDTQSSQTLSITIDDRLQPVSQKLVAPDLSFGSTKRLRKVK